MRDRGLISTYDIPAYGDDTVYRLAIEGIGEVAIIQKGCPDGAHSSVRWTRPSWASETYLWWLCSSLAYEPGEHVVKGVNRLRQRFFSEASGHLDGVIFHNQLCGSLNRPCPKASKSIDISGKRVPPPCIYTMPDPAPGSMEWNWDGGQSRLFPSVLLRLFEIAPDERAAFQGHVGFQKRGGSLRSTITSRYGLGRSSTFRN